MVTLHTKLLSRFMAMADSPLACHEPVKLTVVAYSARKRKVILSFVTSGEMMRALRVLAISCAYIQPINRQKVSNKRILFMLCLVFENL